MTVSTSRDIKIRSEVHTFIILVQLSATNYSAFCCLSKDIKEKGKSPSHKGYALSCLVQTFLYQSFTKRKIPIPSRPCWGVTLTERIVQE